MQLSRADAILTGSSNYGGEQLAALPCSYDSHFLRVLGRAGVHFFCTQLFGRVQLTSMLS